MNEMIIKASASLRNDYTSISSLAKKTNEPIFITKNGGSDSVILRYNVIVTREFYLALVGGWVVVEGDFKAFGYGCAGFVGNGDEW